MMLLMALVMFAVPLISGGISKVYGDKPTVKWTSTGIGVLVSLLIFLSVFLAQGGRLSFDVLLILIVIAGFWLAFFWLGQRIGRPFGEIRQERLSRTEKQDFEDTFS
ncbi:hypothetical protein [Ponticaulis sp.]|uniref:hypothetical protein n=1 Tax=Ponticaulis sp. TaxID=2020902 RepID=UPI000C5D9334|nr:hypothetical protein [Ponticaulis sp.]MAJ10079.1 hypothetical protein [Ponticaulis sp.]HBH90586.1 hypothetical protein [Hyphomonadaceae bacterium]HBJ93716.1 hypothetical protein [Hyphomonadaceae bacterium]|tara:strand:- start:56 stop:376 length:321 start_codon:yes stop_codon:yes gene_type:complete